jgi:hypothetical protein
MSSFTPDPIAATPAALDPSKHVNFTLGMVLGVDDFNQEFAYLSNRDQWQMRDVIGYGTVCGLDVTTPDDAQKGPQVRVAEGVALNPRGQFIRVTPAQCAALNDWLNEERIASAVAAHLDDGNHLHVYLKLCYRDCLTDSVPVPGEPCRTEDAGNLLRPSRIQDNFSLDLCLEPPITGCSIPDQEEEDALRACVAWMRRIPILESGSTLKKLLDAIRAAADDGFAHPPAAALAIPGDDLANFLREAFLLWTTEIRPTVRGHEADCVTPLKEDCVLLAELTFRVTGSAETNWAVSGKVTLDESRRPYLLHLRMLQEWLLTAKPGPTPGDNVVNETAFGQAASPGTVAVDEYSRANHTHGTPPDPIPPHVADPHAHALGGDLAGFVGEAEVVGIHTIPIAADPKPADGQVLGFVKDHWEPVGLNDDKALVEEIVYDQKPDHGKSLSFARADHTHGTPPNPIPPHRADAAAHALAGDVSGVVGRNEVEGIIGFKVAKFKPDEIKLEGQPVLGFVKDHWELVAQQGGASGSFVQHPPTSGRYAIVAAGICRYSYDQQKGTLDAGMETTYNELAVVDREPGQFGPIIFFNFRPVAEFNNFPLVIKLTSMIEKDAIPRVASVITVDNTFFGVNIAPIFNNELPFDGRLMIEVSQFEPDGGK